MSKTWSYLSAELVDGPDEVSEVHDDQGVGGRGRTNFVLVRPALKYGKIQIVIILELTGIYYPQDVSSMKFCCLGVFRKEYVTKQCN